MRIFKDNVGRDWTVAINVAAVKRCRGLVGVDLYALVDGGFDGLSRLLGDPVQFVDTLYVLCKQEADARGVSDEDFGRGLGGDALGAATDAFLEELTDFFPDPRVRAGLRRVLATARTVRDRMLDRMDLALDAIDPDAEATRLTGSSGNWPESSASTPAPSPGGSWT
jgi:hypothetical protein